METSGGYSLLYILHPPHPTLRLDISQMAPGVTAQRTGVKKGARLIGKGGPSQGFHPAEKELVKRT